MTDYAARDAAVRRFQKRRAAQRRAEAASAKGADTAVNPPVNRDGRGIPFSANLTGESPRKRSRPGGGPQAILYPGHQQHARAAIQWLSGAIRQERIFTHTGWRALGRDWVYLQSGGAVGAQGLRCDVQVQLPAALEHYQVRPPVDAAEGVGAIRAGLRFLSVAPDRISCPLLAAVYRAALGKEDFSLFLAGPSGSFKTALASLCQQHFGAAMDAKALPAHFESTANALEVLAFTTKEALLVVDDFVPTGGTGDGELQGTAERLFRGAGNRQGRGRMSGSGCTRLRRRGRWCWRPVKRYRGAGVCARGC
jgi:hypothetical protein